MKVLLVCLFILLSCKEEDVSPQVDPLLKVAFTTFLNELKIRGLSIKTNHLIIKVEYIKTTGLTHYGFRYTTITINKALFLNNYTPDALALEYILFHELGHFMGRTHNINYSIMNPNKYAGDYHNDPDKRKLLIDELLY